MKVFTCTGFKGVYPVGTAAVVVAPSEAKARKLLAALLRECKLSDDLTDARFKEVNTERESATILLDGDY